MRRFLVSLPLLWVVVATPAFAYLIPPLFLMKLLAEERADAKINDISVQLRVEQTDAVEPADQRIYLKAPERMRIVDEEEDGRVYVEKEGKRAAGTEGNLERLGGEPNHFLARLFFPKGTGTDSRGQRMLGTLREIDVDTDVIALGRFDGDPAYIVGARVWEPDEPQAWFDKDTFLPEKIVFFRDGVRHEIRYREYGAAATGNWFPRVIERYEDGELTYRGEVIKVEINQDLPETLFELP